MAESRDDIEGGAEVIGPDWPPREVIEKLVEMIESGKLNPESVEQLRRLRDERFQGGGRLRERYVERLLKAYPGLSREAALAALELFGG